MSVLFALVAAIGWGSSDFAAGHASRRSSAVSVVILTHFAAVVALVVVSLVPGQGGSPAFADLAWGLAAGLGGGFGAMLLFRGLGKGSMAVVAPITATGAASIPVLAGVAQGDPITLFGMLGVLLALVAIVMVSLAGDEAGDADAADGTEPDPLGVDRAEPLNRWSAPSGAPVSTQPPAPLAVSAPRFDPSFAPAVAGPATVFAASAPLSQEMPPPAPTPPAPTPPAPLPPAAAQAPSWLPAPLQHASLLAPPAAEPSSVARSGAVALLEQPPVSAPALPTSPPSPPPPPPPGPPAPGHAPLAEPSAVTACELPSSPPGEPVSALEQLRSIVHRPGVVDALLSGVGFGLFFVFIARTAESAGHWPLVSARGISVVMFVLGALISRGAVLPEKGSRRAVVLAGVLDAAAALFFVLSTRDGLLSVGAVLASLYPAVTIVLARIISKERIVKRQLVGLGLAALAVSLLAI